MPGKCPNWSVVETVNTQQPKTGRGAAGVHSSLSDYRTVNRYYRTVNSVSWPAFCLHFNASPVQLAKFVSVLDRRVSSGASLTGECEMERLVIGHHLDL